MQCYRPIRLTNENYYWKHGIKSNTETHLFPCGKCLGCHSQRMREWTMRFLHEYAYYKQSDCIFLTLTYNNQHIPKDYGLCKADYQKYFKRLRKAGLKFKYLLCGEYGVLRGRPHYHAILFGIRNENYLQVRNIMRLSDCKYEIDKILFRKWNKGKIQIGTVNNQSIEYCLKYALKGHVNYINNKDYYQKFGRIRPFKVVSKGIGKRYALDNVHNLCQNLFITYNNIRCSIPRQYINWIDKNYGCMLLSKIQEKCYIDKDKQIADLYKNYNIPALSIFDFANFKDYYDIYNHPRLYKVVENSNLVKEFKYTQRHKKYLTDKINSSLAILTDEVA